MKEHIDKSEFFHFGILPQICIHSLIEDKYSQFYIPREFCACGSKEWVDGEIKIIRDLMGYEYPKKKVHRCASCNEVRMADHISINKAE